MKGIYLYKKLSLFKLVSLRAFFAKQSRRSRRQNPRQSHMGLLRHFVSRNDTLLAIFFCFFLFFAVQNILADNEIENKSANTPDIIFRPKIEFTARGLRDPFKDYVTTEEISIGEKIEGSKENEVFNPPALKIEGMIWGGIKPCAIINGEVKKEGEDIAGVTILKIGKEGLELLYEGKKYNLPSVLAASRAE